VLRFGIATAVFMGIVERCCGGFGVYCCVFWQKVLRFGDFAVALCGCCGLLLQTCFVT